MIWSNSLGSSYIPRSSPSSTSVGCSIVLFAVSGRFRLLSYVKLLILLQLLPLLIDLTNPFLILNDLYEVYELSRFL